METEKSKGLNETRVVVIVMPDGWDKDKFQPFLDALNAADKNRVFVAVPFGTTLVCV